MPHSPEIQIKQSLLPTTDISLWFAPTLAILFAILWAVWLLPHTVFIRHSCMALGGLLGLYVCFINRRLFIRKQAASIYCIALFFLWVSVHLVFIGQDSITQLDEYFGVWKKVFICTPFALGLGFAIAGTQKNPLCWKIFYVGLSAPTLIYFCKLVLTINSAVLGISSPFLLIDSNHTQSLFGISRALYTFYCIPSFAIALSYFLYNSNSYTKFDIFYVISIVLVPILFYLEGDRTGLLMVGLILLAAFFHTCYLMVSNFNFKFAMIGLILVAGVSLASLVFMQKFDRWRSIAATTTVALDIDTYEQWKYQGSRGYPRNGLGELVEGSNYERIAWWIAGSRLLLENPQGYGLLTLSFDRLSKEKWPGSTLSMTHSGWLDFALGYGFPGFLLLIAACLLCLYNGLFLPIPWNGFVIWGFGSLNTVFLFKELSNEICVNALIFIILFILAFSTAVSSQSISKSAQ